ncbi:MAG TPA: hypothetical protein IAB54_08730 [Candidatus Scatomonas merdigallinarum]|nr:hypothetical protein [Candidatus Scatomonas merdigallinarum]
MAQGILNAKLDELDRQLRKVHRKIQKSGSANPARLRADLEQVRKEYAENEKALRNRLRFSRSGVVTGLSVSYNQVEQIIRETKNKMKMPGGQEAEKEEKILLAEYALDFAMQAAERALLLSLEAMEAQTKQQEKKEETMP